MIKGALALPGSELTRERFDPRHDSPGAKRRIRVCVVEVDLQAVVRIHIAGRHDIGQCPRHVADIAEHDPVSPGRDALDAKLTGGVCKRPGDER